MAGRKFSASAFAVMMAVVLFAAAVVRAQPFHRNQLMNLRQQAAAEAMRSALEDGGYPAKVQEWVSASSLSSFSFV